MKLNITLLLIMISLFFNCASIKYGDISYIENENFQLEKTPTLNVFAPKSKKDNTFPVLIFVHGGYWNSGKKETYNILGRNFAKKNILTVIPDYTLSPNANYDDMTKEIASVIKWVSKNIDQYKGNPDEIFLTGHSAGGHLIALAATNPKYSVEPKSIKGIILNDAAGLDMHNYLMEYPPTQVHNYLTTWTDKPDTWKEASPIYFVNESTPPIKIYLGSKTYPSIIKSNERFIKELNKYQPDVKMQIMNKKHVPMITQFLWPWSKRYKEMVQFIKEN